MKTQPNFRISANQIVDFPAHGVQTVTFLGKCPLTGVRLYKLPKGVYLEHQAKVLKAADYATAGDDFITSQQAWDNFDSRVFIEQMAKARWSNQPEMVKAAKDLRPSGIIAIIARRLQCTNAEVRKIAELDKYLIPNFRAIILMERLIKAKK